MTTSENPSSGVAGFRVLVTGSRDWTDREAVDRTLSALAQHHETMTVVHGAHSRGADQLAHEWCTAHRGDGVLEEAHPADWDRLGNAAGPARNRQMVRRGAHLVLAFPLPGSRGTRHCMSEASRAGIPVHVVEPATESQTEHHRFRVDSAFPPVVRTPGRTVNQWLGSGQRLHLSIPCANCGWLPSACQCLRERPREQLAEHDELTEDEN